MSIIQFHRGLIAAAILFCFGYGAWELLGYRGEGPASVAVGGLFVLLGVGLAVYLARLDQVLGYQERRPRT